MKSNDIDMILNKETKVCGEMKELDWFGAHHYIFCKKISKEQPFSGKIHIRPCMTSAHTKAILFM